MFKVRHKRSYGGKPFVVTIDHSTMERGYSIREIHGDGSVSHMHTIPLKHAAFVKRCGFEPEWPHIIRKK